MDTTNQYSIKHSFQKVLENFPDFLLLLEVQLLKKLPNSDSYSNLFNDHFKSKHKSKQIADAMQIIVNNLDNKSVLDSYLKRINATLTSYNLGSYYSECSQCILIALKQFSKTLGQDWNSEIEDQWILTVGKILDLLLMIDRTPTTQLEQKTTQLSDPANNDLLDLVKKTAYELMAKQIEIGLETEFRPIIEKKVRTLFAQVFRAEMQKIANSMEETQKIS